MEMSVWSLSGQQSVFQRYHSEKHLSEFYPQDGRNSQLALKLRHCHSMYSHADPDRDSELDLDMDSRVQSDKSLRHWQCIGIDSVPIQLAHCRFSGLAISNATKINIYFQIKYTEAILSNISRKLLRFEITKMLIAV